MLVLSRRDGPRLKQPSDSIHVSYREDSGNRKRLCKLIVLATIAFILQPLARGEDPVDVLPDDPRLDSIETPAEFYGFEIGSRHLRHDQVVAYLEYLAGVSDRVQLLPYAKSYGNRPLLVAAISSSENQSKLDQVRSRRRSLTNGKPGRKLDNELLVMYLGYCVHGDEASAVNAAPLVAYHLASSDSEQVQDWLAHAVFLHRKAEKHAGRYTGAKANSQSGKHK